MKCPICKNPLPDPAGASPSAPGEPPANTHFPFCSERCKLVDLGRWLDGKYQIPAEPDETDGPEMPGEET